MRSGEGECPGRELPEVSIDQIGQVLTSAWRLGLVCRAMGLPRGPFYCMCFNYASVCVLL